MKQIPALGVAPCAADLSAATKISRRPLFLFALCASVMMLQNARAQSAADYFNTGTPIGSIYNSFTPAELNAGGYSFNQIMGTSPGYDFASIKAAAATASDFYNAPMPISAVYTPYTLALAALGF